MRNRTTRIPLLVSALVAVFLVATGATSAGAASESSGLTLTIGAAPYFLVGEQGGLEDYCGCGPEAVYSTVNAALYIHATSKNSPITDYGTWAGTLGAGTGYPNGGTHTSYSPNPLEWQADNYDGSEGGGGYEQGGWQIQVEDAAGQKVLKNEGYLFQLLRWNNANPYAGGYGPNGTWAFSPGWTTSTCSCADGGSMTKTATAGAYGSFLITMQASGGHLGLMMATGPTRGRADIYVDGKFVYTVDTYASSNNNRIYVWDSGPLAKGQHTIKVVNEATNGRPNIYINGMGALVSWKSATCGGTC